ncbi:hypothetical protein E0H73_00475 [Kribbella pittospori]|uniref:Uncharacterized protein n=1 Tax=Kribbella pittospori TaxID=722689 RepID=A0A4R0KXT6_9ACTN|nr:hypothetical protein E0H73_00475 [Kribbella pittospori]
MSATRFAHYRPRRVHLGRGQGRVPGRSDCARQRHHTRGTEGAWGEGPRRLPRPHRPGARSLARHRRVPHRPRPAKSARLGGSRQPDPWCPRRSCQNDGPGFGIHREVVPQSQSGAGTTAGKTIHPSTVGMRLTRIARICRIQDVAETTP